MSFWSKLKKGLLKAAPIAAAFIPGVGPLASMAIAAGTSAATKKLEGGSWKDALVSGGIGALTSKIPIKGLGPSKPDSFINSAVSSTANKATGGGIKSAIGNIAKNTAKSYLPGGENDVLPGIINKAVNRSQGVGIGPSSPPQDMAIPRAPQTGIMPRGGYGYNENPMNQLDQSNPNLAQSIFQGRQEAIRNQPFRKGYDITTPNREDPKLPPVISKMPPIYPGGGQRKRPQAAY